MTELERLNNSDRFAEVAELHANAFNWQPQDRIPLGIHVVNPAYAQGLDYADWLNPEPFLQFQTRVLADTLAVGSDLLPAVAVNHVGNAPLTSMFGAEQLMPDSSGPTLQDVGPAPRRVFLTRDQLDDIRTPSLDSGILPEIEKFVSFYRRNLPDWVHVVPPNSGPFTTAMDLRGSQLILDIIESPELAHRLINTCAGLLADVELRLRRLADAPPDTHITSFAILGAGLRLSDDSIVNLSPDMIRDFCLPAFALINRRLPGRGHIHFCSLPAHRFEYLYSVFTEIPDIAVVSSQLAFEYYENHLEELRGRLAVESFYGIGYEQVCRKHGSFRDWALSFVPRYKNESGLVLYFQVDSIDEGREIWKVWQKAHRQ